MKILITGGTGFIGKQVADQLLRTGTVALEGDAPRPISKLVLFDPFPGEHVWTDPRVEVVAGDIADPQTVERVAESVEIVWHLAAVVSSAAEADFDLGMQTNLSGLTNLLETLRAIGTRPRVVNASSYAVFGGELPHTVTDATALSPKTSYGTQKAIGELLVADYSRKGFIDGRNLRLPTIAIRPGKPNKAASTFVSSIIREPLRRLPAVCPARPDTLVFVSSPRSACEAMLRAMNLSDRSIGPERTIPLPGLTVSIAEMVAVLERVAGPEAPQYIEWKPDPQIQRIIDSWPLRVDASRARALGFATDRNFEEIVRAHIEDEAVPRWWRK
ncbi:MAG TPA: D-erythronate dehydrogenase [Candidatus Acidoferrum sp.]|nr:D-erythronate dehydrogenase [Candidatus Acidoferrum sp.]